MDWEFEVRWRTNDRSFWLRVCGLAGIELQDGCEIDDVLVRLQRDDPDLFSHVLAYATIELCDFPVIVEFLPAPVSLTDTNAYFMVATCPITQRCMTFYRVGNFASQFILVLVPAKFSLREIADVVIDAARKIRLRRALLSPA